MQKRLIDHLGKRVVGQIHEVQSLLEMDPTVHGSGIPRGFQDAAHTAVQNLRVSWR